MRSIKTLVRCVLFTVIGLGVLPDRALAQDVAPLRLSLEDARMRAVIASHRLAEARATAAAAEAVVEIRQAADRPLVGVSSGYTRTSHVIPFFVPGSTGAPVVTPTALYPDIPDNYRARLDLQWPIYNGGRTDALERAARAEASAAAAEIGSAQADLRLEVTRAFWAMVTAQSAAEVLRQSLARAEAHVEDVRQRFTAGLVPPNEIASAEAQASRERMFLIEAENQRALASAELARVIGVDLRQPIETIDTLELLPPAVSPLDTLVAEARSTRDERRALELRVTAADEQQNAAEAGRRPTISITSGFDYARPNPRIFPRADRWDDFWEAGVTVGWSLWDGGRTRAETLQAANVAVATRQRLAEFDSVLALEVRQRMLEIDSGRAAVAAAADSVRAAAEAQRVVNERYKAGVISQTEALDANVALLQAELDRTRAIASVRLAEARLDRALGR
ncbi:MAG TPA: TolC family protein [Vicinamibacterales bacterium]